MNLFVLGTGDSATTLSISIASLVGSRHVKCAPLVSLLYTVHGILPLSHTRQSACGDEACGVVTVPLAVLTNAPRFGVMFETLKFVVQSQTMSDTRGCADNRDWEFQKYGR